MSVELVTTEPAPTTPLRSRVRTDPLPYATAPIRGAMALGGPGDVVGQQSALVVLNGYRLRAVPRVDQHGWLGPLCATAPAVHDDGTPATAHVLLGVTDRPTRMRILADAATVKSLVERLDSPFLTGILGQAVDADRRPVLFTAPFGPSLASELVERGPLPLEDVLAAAKAAAAGLAALHSSGQLHYVVSPRALLRRPDKRIQLSCPAFPALAERIADDRDGTGHEAPEVLSHGAWTPAADLYALASTLWTLLTGEPPVSGTQEERLVKIHDGVRPTMSRSDLPEEFVPALTAALAVDPADRPASAPELVALLEGRSTDLGVPRSRRDTEPPTGVRPLGSGYQMEGTPIGEGATGVVYRVRRLADDAVLAAKLLKPELAADSETMNRFLAQRTSMKGVTHPNLVKVHDVVVEHNDVAIVMDLVNGVDLRHLIGSPRLDRAERLHLLSEVADALAALHDARVIHRDVKPENVLVTGSGPDYTALLTDFGLVKLDGRPTMTRQSQLLGTMGYVAPEVATGRGATSACDVYSLGVTGYELLTGRQPHVGTEGVALLLAHVEQTPTQPPEISDPEWALLSTCLAKDPAARPTARRLSDGLAALSADPHVTVPASALGAGTATAEQTVAVDLPETTPNPTRIPTPPPWHHDPAFADAASAPARTARRRPWPLFTAVLATAAAGAAIGVWLATPNQPGPQPQLPDPDGIAPLYPVAINTKLNPHGDVELSWSTEVERLPGFQSYAVMRDGRPVDELDGGMARYTDLAPGDDPCYRVFALGVTAQPPNPPPPEQCPKR